ncbi:DUF4397 domain-containing protein [Haloarcula salinisoli]|uniref:DUF4397 domain-containing protein n=1 Tax=Haloarcula salinisoli TaxID=2487746 RepID=A0A8J7YFP2_9EURY|nr:DUF4397 domain-containing protein [Halomicroarcula salinisoli]MBX0287683.1 DUF4397 domain-containing protein [Halomicroarcula salinisoli]MBX0304612.1 DUF4397 domain-containing protein [Halomicroarcula salinisoli]
MQRNSKTRRGVLTVAGGALVALAGCSNSGGQSGTPTETGTESGEMASTDTETAEPTETEAEQATEDETETPMGGDAMLRVAHLAPDAPNVDVAVDGTAVLTDVPFETVSDYLSLTTGEHQITVTPTGGSEAVFDQTVSLASGRQTAAAIGEVSGQNQAFTVTLLTDDAGTADTGNTNVRAVHTIPDAPAVDVTSGETVIADMVEFGDAGEYVTVPSDTSTVELRPDSLANDEEPVGTFSVDLTDMAAQTVFATGYLEPSGGQPEARLVVATDAEPDGMTGGTETGTGTATPTGTSSGM